jgi:hypothetical protein
MPDSFNEKAKIEWRDLGFYCDPDTQQRTWRFIGSVRGLTCLMRLLRAYAKNPNRHSLSEHDHYGPYGWLEIGTWKSPVISDHWIAGTIPDLIRLSNIIERVLSTAQAGDIFNITKEYDPDAQWDIVLEVKEDKFDPARADLGIWEDMA